MVSLSGSEQFHVNVGVMVMLVAWWGGFGFDGVFGGWFCGSSVVKYQRGPVVVKS